MGPGAVTAEPHLPESATAAHGTARPSTGHAGAAIAPAGKQQPLVVGERAGRRTPETVTMDRELWHEARYALTRRITLLRADIAWYINQDGGYRHGTDRHVANTALYLRQAELAYYRLGGTNPDLWPAVYRPIINHQTAAANPHLPPGDTAVAGPDRRHAPSVGGRAGTPTDVAAPPCGGPATAGPVEPDRQGSGAGHPFSQPESRTTTSPDEGSERTTSCQTVQAAPGQSPPTGPTEPGAWTAPRADRLAPTCPGGEGEPAKTATTGGQEGSPPVPPTLPCCGGWAEHFDWCPLAARATDRNGPRYLTPLGDRRQRPTVCPTCGEPDVWALDGLCDRCATDRAARTLTHLEPDAVEVMVGRCEACRDGDHLCCDQPAATSRDSFGVVDIDQCCCGSL